MAEKRMFSNKVIGSDNFLEMPATSQNLYFHLSMQADDEGFIDKYKSIMRMIGAKEDDLRVLISKSFVIMFESGVLVIRHWRLNNYLQNDRTKETVFLEEKSQLLLEKNKMYTKCIQDVSIDKNRLEEYSKEYIMSPSQATKFIEIEKLEENVDKKQSTQQSTNNLPYISNIFNYWNEKDIIKHKELSDKFEKAIKKAIKIYSEEEIKTCIDRYSKVLKDKNYFFDYKWTLSEFLERKDGISSFTDEGSKWLNYNQQFNNKSKKKEQNFNGREYDAEEIKSLIQSIEEIEI